MGYLICSLHTTFVVKKMVEPYVDAYSNVENKGKCWQGAFHMFCFFEHAMLFLLDLTFEWSHQ